MPLESMNLYPVSSAHRVVSTDSLILPIVSGREKELARTYIFFRTFTSKSINFRREIPLCSFFWKQATSSGDETFLKRKLKFVIRFICCCYCKNALMDFL